MMYIQLPTKFFFDKATPLTGITVSMPGISLLLMPVRAVIRRITAAPVEVVFSAESTTFRLPVGHTFFGTKPSSVSVGLFDTKGAFALRAYFVYSPISIRMRAGQLRSRLSLSGDAQIFPKTFLGAESNAAPPLSFWYFFLTLFAKFRRNMNNSKILLHSDSRCGALDRAIRRSPAFSAGKFLPALWTGFGYPAKTIRTFLRTAFSIWIGRINLERGVANNTISYIGHIA